MRNLYILLLTTLTTCATLNAQVKIGDNPQNIDASSVLELESTDKVLVITRVTTAQMNAIVPSQGALCFNTDLQSVHYYNGTQWVNIGGSNGTGGPLTADAIVNTQPTIVITPTANGDNLEVAPNSIRSEQIVDGGVNGIDIQDGSIGPGKLQDFSITQEKLSENSVGAFALDNDSFGVSAFNNDVGYLTAADINLVSGDVGNVLENRIDGVFYNDQPLITAIDQNTDAIALDNDQSAANEIQNPVLTGSVLGLTDTAGTVDLGPLISAGGSDDQNLTLNGNTIEIEDGNTIDLSPILGAGGSDDQNLTLNGNTIEIEDGNTIDLTPLLGTGGSDDQNLTLNGNTIEIEDGNTIDLSPILGAGGSDDQNLTLNGNTIEIEDGNTIDLTPLLGAGGSDDQNLTLNGNTIEIEDGNTIDLSPILGAGGSDNQTATEVPFTPYLTIGSTDTQAAVQELKDEVDVLSVSGGGLNSVVEVTTDSLVVEDAGGRLGILLSELPSNGSNNSLVEVTTDSLVVEDAGGRLGIALTELPSSGSNNSLVEVTTDSLVVEDAGGRLGIALTELPSSGSNNSLVEVTTDSLVVEDAGGRLGILLSELPSNGSNNSLVEVTTDSLVVEDAGGRLGILRDSLLPKGEPKSIFFAGADGLPRQFFNPDNDEPSFYWDYEGRTAGPNSYGTLAIGLDGGVISNDVKVHIAEQLPLDLSYNLMLQNRDGRATTAVGMVFSVDDFTTTFGKGALVFERTDNSWQIGDFHFLQNAVTGPAGFNNPALATDKAFTITSDKNIRLYGGIEIDGTGPGTGSGANNQVLASGGPGNPVKWVNNGGIPNGTANNQVIKWNNTTLAWELGSDNAGTPGLNNNNIFVGNASNNAVGVPMSGDAQIANTGELTIQPNAVENGMLDKANIPLSGFGAAGADVAMGGFKITNLTDPTADQEAATKKYVDDNGGGHTGTAAGSVFFAGAAPNFTPTDNNAQLFWDNTDTKLYIGPQNTTTGDVKLNVGGTTRTQGLKNSDGSAATPSYRFTNDLSSGMYSAGVNILGFSAGGTEAVRIDGTGATPIVVVNQSLELDGALLDKDGDPGTTGQVLSSTGGANPQTDWVDSNAPVQKEKVLAGSPYRQSIGAYSVPVTGQTTNDYVINLSVQQNVLADPIMIQIVSQNTVAFSVQILQFDSSDPNFFVPVDADWHYTIYNP